MEELNRLEERVEAVVARIQELEEENRKLLAEMKDISETNEILKMENEKLLSEKDNIATDYGKREKEVKNRLESLLSQVEKVELEIK